MSLVECELLDGGTYPSVRFVGFANCLFNGNLPHGLVEEDSYGIQEEVVVGEVVPDMARLSVPFIYYGRRIRRKLDPLEKRECIPGCNEFSSATSPPSATGWCRFFMHWKSNSFVSSWASVGWVDSAAPKYPRVLFVMTLYLLDQLIIPGVVEERGVIVGQPRQKILVTMPPVINDN